MGKDGDYSIPPENGDYFMTDKTGSEQLSKILADMNARGGFLVSVLTDLEGLPLASAAADGESPEMQAAVVALIQKSALQTSKVNMDETDEVTVFDRQGRRLVCRPFQVDERALVLAVMVPRDQSYRRLTRQAIAAVRQAWTI
jgi:predicted regulator of Ras-like GTPase activity (Roadblock/LC7/MglB family)